MEIRSEVMLGLGILEFRVRVSARGRERGQEGEREGKAEVGWRGKVWDLGI